MTPPTLAPPRPAAQQPDWPDRTALRAAATALSHRAPLVRPEECDRLRGLLAGAAAGHGFLVQGGDCAETFADTAPGPVRAKTALLAETAALIESALRLPVTVIGRMAGQFAKPRSRPTELVDGVSLPVYRGDMVNGSEPTPVSRRPDPARLLRAYDHAREAVLTAREGSGREVFTSHEALILEYEDALARRDAASGATYGLSGHYLWLGERTRQYEGAHVEFAAGVANPVGVKLGPTAEPDDVLALAARIDPDRVPGRLSFITRMGSDKVRDLMPVLVEKARAEGVEALWVCDPMHGNTYTAANGLKTRRYDDVLDEVRGFFEVHRELGTWPGGLHLEFSPDAVTECVGGPGPATEADLTERYTSTCDPRLNRAQTLALAGAVAELFTGFPAGPADGGLRTA
ncbi:3-deoxy-7-phosphoheptulonate synthase [Streptomyces sp. NPDC058326]|uniref:3-deoxy-7-phosphoheptulonate synthase n=1 Tax=Streptomyces sp. NPDC058326 TaxID=3346447 RepID=UPI0036F0F52F